jgi:hypothetical protein
VPSTLQRSGTKTHQTFAETHDSAIEQATDKRRARQVAVTSLNERLGDHWEPKDEYGPSNAQARAAKHLTATNRGVDANASKRHLYELATPLVPSRSKMTKDDLVTALQKANDRASAKARAE